MNPVIQRIMQYCFSQFDTLTQYNESKVPFYNLGDSKCVYKMTSHSQRNRINYRFTKCICKRGMSLDENHECIFLSDIENIGKIIKSNDIWKNRPFNKQQRGARRKKYNVKEHHDWCDDFFLEYIILVQYLLLTSLQFDVFHGNTNIVKVIFY